MNSRAPNSTVRRQLIAEILRTAREQIKRARLIADPAALEQYARDRGIAAAEMQSLLETNFESAAVRMRECIQEVERMPAAPVSSISWKQRGEDLPEIATEKTGLTEALCAAKRQTRWGPVNDPVAEDVLRSHDFDQLEDKLAALGIRALKPLAGGMSSVVLDAGDTVVRLGLGSLQPRPSIPEVLQALASGTAGNLRYEVLPKADVESVSEQDLKKLMDSLEQQGIRWADAGVDNIGRVEGRLVVLDHGGMTEACTSPFLIPAAPTAQAHVGRLPAVQDALEVLAPVRQRPRL